MQPNSRGSIRLQSTNSSDHPLIDPNYFHKAEDLEVMLQGEWHVLVLRCCSFLTKRRSGIKFVLLILQPRLFPGHHTHAHVYVYMTHTHTHAHTHTQIDGCAHMLGPNQMHLHVCKRAYAQCFFSKCRGIPLTFDPLCAAPGKQVRNQELGDLDDKCFQSTKLCVKGLLLCSLLGVLC